MPSASKRHVLFAMATGERGQSLSDVLAHLRTTEAVPTALIVTTIEELLFHTRGSVPAALVVEHELVKRVEQLDLVTLLRRRKSLAQMPLIYLGPDQSDIQAAALDSGVDAYLPPDVAPVVLAATLGRLLERSQTELALRTALERLREFERAYRDSERVKDDLTHMLVHDLKSPIASVIGLLDHSLEITGGGDRDDSIAELLGLARAEVQHLLNLTANILDVRRMKDGHMPFAPARIEDLATLARQALGDVSAAQRQRSFDFLVQDDALQLDADPSLLRRILANLFSNAVKHTRNGGCIDFRAWRTGESFVLSVRDDGEGIPEADHKRIFNAFEQSRHTVHDRYDTGMGLTFCKLAVEKHGGRIWVESKPGQGSTFIFTIPVSVEQYSSYDGTVGYVR